MLLSLLLLLLVVVVVVVVLFLSLVHNYPLPSWGFSGTMKEIYYGNGKLSNKVLIIRIPTSRRQTSWLCTGMAEDLNLEPPRTNPATSQASRNNSNSGLQKQVQRPNHSATLPPTASKHVLRSNLEPLLQWIEKRFAVNWLHDAVKPLAGKQLCSEKTRHLYARTFGLQWTNNQI